MVSRNLPTTLIFYGILRDTAPAGNDSFPLVARQSKKGNVFTALPAMRSGISLMESYAMSPRFAVSGYYFFHPDSRHFGAAEIGWDQAAARATGLGLLTSRLSPPTPHHARERLATRGASRFCTPGILIRKASGPWRTFVETKCRMVERRRFTAEKYYKMAEASILHEDDPVKLPEDEIIDMKPIGSRHMACLNQLTRLLVEFAGRRYVVRVQGSTRLDDGTEPQPELALRAAQILG
jgi:hypothetical protein